ncbi:unnamed protein product, partial [Didymodactylos carnosus]
MNCVWGSSDISILPSNVDSGNEGGVRPLPACQTIYSQLIYPRVVRNISVIELFPLRVRIEVEMKTSESGTFTVDGLVCQRGFTARTADAVCRSLRKKQVSFETKIDWKETPTTGCHFQWAGDTTSVPCKFLLDTL